jgi:hypothetical protein
MKNLILFCISFVWALPQSFDFIPLIVENEPASTETAELHDVIEKNNPTRSGNERIPDAVDTEKGNNSEDENETVAETNSGGLVGAEKSEENKAQTNDKSDKNTPKPNDESNNDSQNPIDENDNDTPKPNDENWNEKENVEDWKTCDSSIVNPCKSQNFTCCLGALDVAENKYTCRAEGYCLQIRYRGYNKIKKN